MSKTLRRSCSACANAKSRCDLRTPHCSRCVGRKILCHYANEPLSASLGSHHLFCQFGSVDPFESYPEVKLGKEHVQRLIYRCTHVSVSTKPHLHVLTTQFFTKLPSNTTPLTSILTQIHF